MPDVEKKPGLAITPAKLGLAFLALLILLLQYRLWVADGSVIHTAGLQKELDTRLREIEHQQAANETLASEIKSLKSGLGEIESRAREELGLVKPDETFFLILEDNGSSLANDFPSADGSLQAEGSQQAQGSLPAEEGRR